MTKYTTIQAYTLPEITVYAGDNTPWEIEVTNADGSLTQQSINCELNVVSLIDADDEDTTTVLTKTITLTLDTDGVLKGMFEFSSSDTLNLYGKYVYQIDVLGTGNSRISQGFLTIIKNRTQG